MQNTITLKTTTSTAATTATKVTSKMALKPGMRVALELNGVPISETQVAQTCPTSACVRQIGVLD